MSDLLPSSQGIKLILHPGYPKCGSSAIQSLLYTNVQLLRRQGIYLPNVNFDFEFMPLAFQIGQVKHALHQSKQSLQSRPRNSLFHVPISYLESVIDRQAYDAFARKLRAIAKAARQSQCHTILLSAENLSGPTYRVQHVHQVLANCFSDVHIIFYFRRQDDWLMSSWQQWYYKQGSNLETTVQTCLEAGIPNYAEMINLLDKTYQHANIEAVPLHPRVLRAGNLGLDFCDRSSIDTQNFDFSHVYRNQSLNPYLCEALAAITSPATNPHDNSLRDLFDKLGTTESFIYTNRKEYFNFQQRSQVMETFKEENRQLLNRFCPQLPYEDFAPVNSPTLASTELAPTVSSLGTSRDLEIIQTEVIITLLRHQQKLARLIYALLILVSITLLWLIIQSWFALRS